MEKRVVEIHQIEEAFQYLCKEMQDHSQRISQYTELLFAQIVAEDLCTDTGVGRRVFVAENKSVAAEAGLYHDIGKAYVPEVYQIYNSRFTAEEEAVYKKHIEDGMNLVQATMVGFNRRSATHKNMILDGIRDHHETLDGTGYPEGKQGDDISYMGQIVGIVNRFDRISMRTVSENPVDEALDILKNEVPSKYNPDFYKCLCSIRGKLKRVFLVHGEKDSQVIKGVDMFVKRRIRPMELAYRPIWNTEKEFLGYDCQMRFSNGKENVWTYDDVKHIISKQGIAADTCLYFIYEACDALRRFHAYQIPSKRATITMMPLFFSKKGIVKQILTVLEQEEMDKRHIRIGIAATQLEKPTKVLLSTIEEMNKNGIPTIVTELEYPMITPKALKEMGINAVRLSVNASNELEVQQLQKWLSEALYLHIEVAFDGVDKLRNLAILKNMGVSECTGLLAGDYDQEKLILEREIAMRQAATDARQ